MLYLRTKRIDSILKTKFDVYHSIWEHTFKKMIQNDQKFREETQRIRERIYTPPSLRSSFYGGRTDISAFTWSTSTHPDEYGIYKDIRLHTIA